MPKMEPLPVEEIKDVEADLRAQIMRAGSNVAKVVEMLNEKYTDRTETPQTLNRQINQGIVPAWKERRIAVVLGYEILWKKK